MRIRNLIHDDDAVSPVIGVILMVAITVILAAVIGAFVLDLGAGTQDTPSASFDFEEDPSSSDVTITMESGDRIDAGLLETKIDGSGSMSTTWSGQYSQVSAGDSVKATGTDSSTTLRITWSSESGDQSSTLADYDVS